MNQQRTPGGEVARSDASRHQTAYANKLDRSGAGGIQFYLKNRWPAPPDLLFGLAQLALALPVHGSVCSARQGAEQPLFYLGIAEEKMFMIH